MFGLTERPNAVRGDRLTEDLGGNETGIDRSGYRAGRRRGQGEGAVVVDGAATEVSLVAGAVENVSRKRVVALNEENHPAAAGQIAFVKPAPAFLCEARNRQGDQKRADLK